MKLSLLKTQAFWKLKAPFLFLNILLMTHILPSSAYTSSLCAIGDETKGRWVMVGAPHQGECKIPGPPHSTSGTGHGMFRIEGMYKIVVNISGKGFYTYQPTCEPECITGIAKQFCKDAYANIGCEANGQNCKMPDWNNDGKPDGYACFTDHNNITLYEWQWFSEECILIEKANPDPGKPCPFISVN